MPNSTSKYFNKFPAPLIGDWLIMVAGLFIVLCLFHSLWLSAPATQLRIRLGNTIYGDYSLQQNKILTIYGHMGKAKIEIADGKVRFLQAPCNNQFCVHQGWLKLAGQSVICLPNRLSLELLGATKQFDTLNY